MPPLNTTQLRHYRQQLEQQREELRRKISDDVAHEEWESYQEIVGSTRDLGDDASADVTADLAIAGLNRYLRDFHDVQQALARIDAGTYGSCVECDDDIAAGRLDAWPSAKRCTRCQQHHEATYAHPRTSTL